MGSEGFGAEANLFADPHHFNQAGWNVAVIE